MSLIAICRCGHHILDHDHYRAGTDCASCGCVRYRLSVRRTVAASLRRRR